MSTRPIKFYGQWYEVFSNFSAHAVEVDGVLYPTSEHAYQVAKCTDPEGREAIRRAKSPMEAKVIANKIYRSAKRQDWNTVKVDIMEAILRAKFAQHKEVRKALLRSGILELMEDSPTDTFWGTGKDGTGQNQLGRLWMKLREEQVENN